MCLGSRAVEDMDPLLLCEIRGGSISSLILHTPLIDTPNSETIPIFPPLADHLLADNL